MTYSNLSPEVQAALQSPAGQEAIQRIAAAFGETCRQIGARLTPVFQALGNKMSEFVKKHGKNFKRILKKIERHQRNLKRMNRKTRAVAMRGKA